LYFLNEQHLKEYITEKGGNNCFWLLVAGYWLLVTGCWLLVTGFCYPNKQSALLHSPFEKGVQGD
jgi:hypothetical protein